MAYGNLRSIGAFIIWALKGFKKVTYRQCYEKNYSFEIGFIVILIAIFLIYIIWP